MENLGTVFKVLLTGIALYALLLAVAWPRFQRNSNPAPRGWFAAIAVFLLAQPAGQLLAFPEAVVDAVKAVAALCVIWYAFAWDRLKARGDR